MIDFQSAARTFEESGYAILRGAIDEAAMRAFEQDFETALREKRPLLAQPSGGEIQPLTGLDDSAINGARFVDVECHLKTSHSLILHDVVRDFFGQLGAAPITNLQTLTYKYSSQQGAHSDLHLVSPPWVGQYDRNTLAASWIAFETADDENGSLVIYPGSHKLPKKRLDVDFDNDYPAYVEYLTELCADAGIQAERFTANRGDILFWHGDFVHAGGPINTPGRTRFSLVSHYAMIPIESPSYQDGREKLRLDNGFFYGSPTPRPRPDAVVRPPFWSRVRRRLSSGLQRLR